MELESPENVSDVDTVRNYIETVLDQVSDDLRRQIAEDIRTFGTGVAPMDERLHAYVTSLGSGLKLKDFDFELKRKRSDQYFPSELGLENIKRLRVANLKIVQVYDPDNASAVKELVGTPGAGFIFPMGRIVELDIEVLRTRNDQRDTRGRMIKVTCLLFAAVTPVGRGAFNAEIRVKVEFARSEAAELIDNLGEAAAFAAWQKVYFRMEFPDEGGKTGL